MTTRRVEPMLNPTTCHCPDGPTLIAAFRDQRLVSVRRQHHPWGCGMADAVIDPAEFVKGARRGR